MNRFLIAMLAGFGFVSLWATPANAQIEIKTSVDRTYYLAGEAIKLTLSISNQSGLDRC